MRFSYAGLKGHPLLIGLIVMCVLRSIDRRAAPTFVRREANRSFAAEGGISLISNQNQKLYWQSSQCMQINCPEYIFAVLENSAGRSKNPPC